MMAKLKYESEVSKRYKDEVERLNFENSKSRLLEKENNELRGQTDELTLTKRRIVEYANTIAIMKDELERLQAVIRSKDHELERNGFIFNENE